MVVAAVMVFVTVVAVFGALLGGGSDPGDDTPVEAALRAGRRVEAIRLYRQQHGVGSREAQQAVDQLQRRQQVGRRQWAPPHPRR